jgi:hypothetical protein
MQRAEDVAVFLLDFLQKTPGQTLTGTQLAQVLRIAYKGFNPLAYGCTNIRAFVARYASPIKEVGAAGADRIYSLNAQASQEAQIPSARSAPTDSRYPRGGTAYLDVPVWKTFVSPNTVFKLFANRETGSVRVVKPHETQPSNPWVQIPSLSSDFHRKLATDFAASLPSNEQREAFTKTLAEPRWWDEIQTVTLRIGVAREWNSYRRRVILDRFHELLKDAGVAVSIVEHSGVEPQEVPSQAVTYQQKETREIASPSQLRDVALRAVKRMTPAELRALAIPLGYIADELNLR